MPQKSAVDDEKWKDQLSFISGNLFAWSLFVLNFWPVLSHFQTGMNFYYFWPLISQNYRIESDLFYYLATLLAIASSIIVLAIAHIFSRGIWLILPEDSVYKGKLDDLCKIMYDTAILFLIFMGFNILYSVFIKVVSTGIEKLLVFLSIPFAGWITVGLMVLIILVFMIIIAHYNTIPIIDFVEYVSKKSRALYLLIIVHIVVLFIIFEISYTMDLTVNGKIFNQTRGDIIEVYVGLGGATSDANVTKLKLLDSNGTLINNLTMYLISQGQYVSYIKSSTLIGGRYEVALEYPPRLLESSYPFVGSKSRKSQGFVIIS